MIKKIILLAMMATTIASCASVGEDKYSEKYIRSYVIENKTTKSEIQSIYGTPDEQFAGSNTGSSWVYRKRDGYKSLDSLSSFIPGAGSVLSSVGIAQNNAEAITSISNKASGNAELSGNVLSFSFDAKNVVISWELH